jgi:hypothetical protein
MKLELIEDLVVKEFQNDFTIPVRTQQNVYQRAVYYRICREFTNKTIKDIGYSIGRDHATVLHGIKLFKNFEMWGEYKLLDSYAKIKNKVQENQDKKYRSALNRKQTYKLLLNQYINLKEKNYKLKQSLQKIS